MLRSMLQETDPEHRQELVRELLKAINEQRFQIEVSGPPLRASADALARKRVSHGETCSEGNPQAGHRCRLRAGGSRSHADTATKPARRRLVDGRSGESEWCPEAHVALDRKRPRIPPIHKNSGKLCRRSVQPD